MSRWPRRFAYSLFFIVWLCVMSLPLIAGILAIRGEIRIGSQPQQQLRLSLLQEAELEGIVIQWTRPTRPLGEQQNCSKSSLIYLMWRGEGENTTFCRCFDPASGEPLPAIDC